MTRPIPVLPAPRSASRATTPTRQAAYQARECVVLHRADALLMHWRIEQDRLRACLPEACSPDLCHGGAWLTVRAAMVRGSRWARLPLMLGGDYAELEVSARVRWQGVPATFILRREAARASAWWPPLDRWLGFAPARPIEIAHEPFADEHALWDARLPSHQPWFRAWCQVPGEPSSTSAPLERFLLRSGAVLHLARGRLRVGSALQRTTALREARAVVVIDRLLPSLGITGMAAVPTHCHHLSAAEVRLSRPVLA
jgi:uncharacterized protein YqjF (DUF2071 family)